MEEWITGRFSVPFIQVLCTEALAQFQSTSIILILKFTVLTCSMSTEHESVTVRERISILDMTITDSIQIWSENETQQSIILL